jgi:hypothetical protein
MYAAEPCRIESGNSCLDEWEAKAYEKLHVIKEHFNYDGLATADDDMRAKAVDYIKAHAKDEKPFFVYLNFEKVTIPTTITPLEGQVAGSGAISTHEWIWTRTAARLVRQFATLVSRTIHSSSGQPTMEP